MLILVLLLKVDLLSVYFKGRLYVVVGFISRHEGGKEKFSVDGGDGEGVVKEESGVAFLYLFDVVFWYFNEGFPEKHSVPVEFRIEDEAMACDE